MCGIVGVINFDGSPVDQGELLAQTDTLAHRGPDGSGIHIYNHIGIGHRRLSIIDLASGAQPMTNEDNSVWISFNGEIYNFREIRHDLEGYGHRFKTNSDTEVIIHGYEHWGIKILERLRGMFAFAIVDQTDEKIFIARDRLGIKPMVYYTDGKSLIFGSEIKAILKHSSVKKAIEPKAVLQYFECGYIPAPLTVYKNIYKLKPAHFIYASTRLRSAIEQKRYWSMVYEPLNNQPQSAIAEELKHLLTESVKIELISDVQLGALLSGGIDSSAVVALMSKGSNRPVNTFSVGFENQAFSEVQYAKEVARHLGTAHNEYQVTPDIRELLPKLVYHFDEPFSDASAIPTYYVFRAARQKVTVCLSGDGGDELFGGYDRYSHCMGQGVVDFLPYSLRKSTFSNLLKMVPCTMKGFRFIEGLARTPNERFLEYLTRQYGYIPVESILSAHFKREYPEALHEGAFYPSVFDSRIKEDLTRFLDFDINSYLPNDILAKADITSMMSSVECRVPLLDHKLVEFVNRIPSNLKIHRSERKYIFKQAVKTELPESILKRKKMGFGVPLREWMAKDLKELPEKYLLNKSKNSGFIEQELLSETVVDNQRNMYKSRLAGKLWWFLFFEMWYQDVFLKS